MSAVTSVQRLSVFLYPCVLLGLAAWAPADSVPDLQESPLSLGEGSWIGVLDPPSGPSRTVVLTLLNSAEPAVGRALYATPSATCMYSLWSDGGSGEAVGLLQRLDEGACAESSRLVLRPAGPRVLTGDWYAADGTHWVSARLEKPASGYAVTLDGYRAAPLGVDGRVTFLELSVGEHTLELHGVPEECNIFGANPRVILTEEGGTLEAAFAVECPGDPRTTSTTP